MSTANTKSITFLEALSQAIKETKPTELIGYFKDFMVDFRGDKVKTDNIQNQKGLEGKENPNLSKLGKNLSLPAIPKKKTEAMGAEKRIKI